MSCVLRAAAAAAALLVTAGARAGDVGSGWELDASVPVDYMGGDTTYEISASDGVSSIRSQLQFPLQGVLAGVHGTLRSPDNGGGRIVFELAGHHSIPVGSGTMKDSDWLDGPVEVSEVGANHAGKDIYSTSKADLSAWVFDGRVGWQVAPSPALRLVPALGYYFQKFSYDVTDVNQVGYGPWNTPAYTGSARGSVLTYDVTWTAVYLGGRAELDAGPLTASLDAWFALAAHGEDRDDHLLRSKLSETSASGKAGMVRLEGRYAVGPQDAVSLQGSLLGFSATGTQHQRFYAGPDAGLSGDIDAKLSSLRWSVGIAVTHRM